MVAAPFQSPQRISIAGFTLLEVLVALTVLGLLLFGLVQGSHFVLLGWDRQTRLAARTEDLDAVDRTLRRLVVQAKPGSKWEPLVFAGTAHSATFTSIVPLPAAGFPTQRADVELVVDAAHRLLLRWMPHFHAINVGRPPPAVTTEILDGVDRLELSYWSANPGRRLDLDLAKRGTAGSRSHPDHFLRSQPWQMARHFGGADAGPAVIGRPE